MTTLKIFFNPHFEPKTNGKVFLTFGNFDGVHLGHQALLKKLNDLSNLEETQSTVLTFFPHPSRVFNPNKPSLLLISLSQRIEFLFKFGVKCVAVQEFNTSFASLTATAFCREYLLNNFNIRGILGGYDLKYGFNRLGNLNHLESFCNEKKILFNQEDPQKLNETVISSSLIRKSLMNGEIAKTNEYLGRIHCLTGKIFKGDRRGRKMGFPTANMKYEQEVLPSTGVYFSLVEVEGDNQKYPAVMNCGFRPTISSGLELQIEAHILNFNRDIYDLNAKFHILDFLRKEMKFSNINELIEQIKKDVQDAKGYFQKRGLL